MKFFEELKGIIGDKTITISITADGERLIVVSLPKDKNEEPLKGFVPLCVSGTPEQLDAGFMNSLAKSVEVLNGLKSNISDVEKSTVDTPTKTTTTSKGRKSKKDEKAETAATEEPSGEEGLPFSDSAENDSDDVFSDVKADEPQAAAETAAHVKQDETKPKHQPQPKMPQPAHQQVQQTVSSEQPAPENSQPINESSDEW